MVAPFSNGKKNGLNTNPKIIAELGPGDSIGIGLAALISGCDRYYAFDVVEDANIERNLSIFNELVTLFRNKTPIPCDNEWPKLKPKLSDYSFPCDLLDDVKLSNALNDSRLEQICNSIKCLSSETSMIKYKVPWTESRVLEAESVDMIYSQAVLEHVDDLRRTYQAMSYWLKPNGFMSHTIDFKCHGTADEWNGHWVYSDFIWGLIRGKRPYLLNRAPCSTHIRIISDLGFTLLCSLKTTSTSNLALEQLAPRFRSITEEDLVTSGVFIQAQKKL